eukprot:299194-Rhodomonas_salina.2
MRIGAGWGYSWVRNRESQEQEFLPGSRVPDSLLQTCFTWAGPVGTNSKTNTSNRRVPGTRLSGTRVHCT